MSNLLRQVALVADEKLGGELKLSDLTRVAAAVQKQAARDFGPLWKVNATVDAFGSLDDVPLGYWPIIIGQEGQHGGGVHLDQHNQPYALVDLTNDWTVTVSHECLEMLADPYGNRLVAGDSPDPANPGRVEFLVEVCDPCEHPSLGYTVNGVRVSDFYTPRYFSPAQKAGKGGGRFDFRGHITQPRQVLKGGYLSWGTPKGEWFQMVFFGDQPQIRGVGKFDPTHGSLRAWIDTTSDGLRKEALRQRPTYQPQVLVRLPGDHDDERNLGDAAPRERAERLRAHIGEVRARHARLAKDGNAARSSDPVDGSPAGRHSSDQVQP